MKITWRVGFMAAAADAPWWQRRLRPGYAHCWAARFVDEGLWLWVEWTPEAILFGHAGPAMMSRAMFAAHEVLEWDYAPDPGPMPLRPILAIHQCASLVSHAIGIRPRPAATPWWLSCAMQQRNARVLIPGKEPAP